MSDATQTPSPRPHDLDRSDDPDPARRLWSPWPQGQQPHVADFLEQAGVRDPEEIVMAPRVDQEERRRLGKWVPADEYRPSPSIISSAPLASAYTTARLTALPARESVPLISSMDR
jgi:hypothetical protein